MVCKYWLVVIQTSQYLGLINFMTVKSSLLLLSLLLSTAITGTINLLHVLQCESMDNGADSCLIFIAGNLHEFQTEIDHLRICESLHVAQ